MLFSKIRSHLGWNNNPNVLQFKWILRALLQKSQITASEKPNYTVVEEDKMDQEMGQVDANIANSLNCSTVWRDDVLSYIAGYIVKKITECAIALGAVDNSQSASADPNSQCKSPSLITFKGYGKLITPSQSVVKVVTAADRHLHALFHDWASLNKKALASLKSTVLQEVKASSFEGLEQHSREIKSCSRRSVS